MLASGQDHALINTSFPFFRIIVFFSTLGLSPASHSLPGMFSAVIGCICSEIEPTCSSFVDTKYINMLFREIV